MILKWYLSLVGGGLFLYIESMGRNGAGKGGFLGGVTMPAPWHDLPCGKLKRRRQKSIFERKMRLWKTEDLDFSPFWRSFFA